MKNIGKHFVYLCIEKQRIMERKNVYRHLGYFNDIPDIRELSRKSADEIIDYYKKGYGKFYEDKSHEPETDLDLEEEEATMCGDIKVTSDKKYVISDTSWVGWKEAYKDVEDGDSDCYIDIYELM